MASGENGGSAGGISSGIGGWHLQRRHRLWRSISISARINENGEILAIFSENMAIWRQCHGVMSGMAQWRSYRIAI
jgi:hypothetical protein